jgi:hypothetical protein
MHGWFVERVFWGGNLPVVQTTGRNNYKCRIEQKTVRL